MLTVDRPSQALLAAFLAASCFVGMAPYLAGSPVGEVVADERAFFGGCFFLIIIIFCLEIPL